MCSLSVTPDDQHLSSSPAHTNPNQRSLTVVGGLKNQKKKENMARALNFKITIAPARPKDVSYVKHSLTNFHLLFFLCVYS